eukprot:s3366_g1.t1
MNIQAGEVNLGVSRQLGDLILGGEGNPIVSRRSGEPILRVEGNLLVYRPQEVPKLRLRNAMAAVLTSAGADLKNVQAILETLRNNGKGNVIPPAFEEFDGARGNTPDSAVKKPEASYTVDNLRVFLREFRARPFGDFRGVNLSRPADNTWLMATRKKDEMMNLSDTSRPIVISFRAIFK